MPAFIKFDKKILRDHLNFIAKVREEGTGKSYYILYFIYREFCIRKIQYWVFKQNGTHFCNMEACRLGVLHSKEKTIQISYVVGKLSFIDTPKFYVGGSIVEGKVSAKCCLHFFSINL